MGTLEPGVEILMVNQNNEEFLPATLASILNQSGVGDAKLPPFTLTFWDNASSDESLDIVRSFEPAFKSRGIGLRIHESNENYRINPPLNDMIKEGMHEYAVAFDGDDVMGPHYLALMFDRYMKAFGDLPKNILGGYVYADTRMIDPDGRELGPLSAGVYLPQRLLNASPYPTCGLTDMRSLQRLVSEMPLPDVVKHSKHPRWAGLAAMGLAGVYVENDPRVHIGYMQHDAQVSGANTERQLMEKRGEKVDQTTQLWGVPESPQLDRLREILSWAA